MDGRGADPGSAVVSALDPDGEIERDFRARVAAMGGVDAFIQQEIEVQRRANAMFAFGEASGFTLCGEAVR